jgi:hypothetical protein
VARHVPRHVIRNLRSLGEFVSDVAAARIHVAFQLMCFVLAACGDTCPAGTTQRGSVCKPGSPPQTTNNSVSAEDSAASNSPADGSQSVAGANATDSSATIGQPGARSGPGTGGSGGSGRGGNGAPSSGTSSASDPCTGHDGENVCDGAVLHHCGNPQSASPSETCKTAELCQIGLGAGTCAKCSPGTFRCQGAQLDTCTAPHLPCTETLSCRSLSS